MKRNVISMVLLLLLFFVLIGCTAENTAPLWTGTVKWSRPRTLFSTGTLSESLLRLKEKFPPSAVRTDAGLF